MIYWLLIPAAVLVLAVLFGRAVPRRALRPIAVACLVLGLAAIAALELRYSTANTVPVTMPVSLDRAATLVTPPFTVAIGGPYEIWLQFDHADEAADFDCLTGAPRMAAPCPRADPPLDLAWRVADNGAVAAQGHTDWSAWHAAQAALDPRAAAAEQRKYRAWQKKNADPSDRWPLFYSAGRFEAQAGHRYVVTLAVHRPAGLLATLHPKLVVGLSTAATKGLGTIVMIFALLWIAAGAVFWIFTVRRGGAAA